MVETFETTEIIEKSRRFDRHDRIDRLVLQSIPQLSCDRPGEAMKNRKTGKRISVAVND